MYERFQEGFGLLLLSFSAWVFIVLFSHNPLDPSANVAINADIQNWGGEGGANVSDMLLQLLGRSAYAVPLGLVLLALGTMKKTSFLKLVSLSTLFLLSFLLLSPGLLVIHWGGALGHMMISVILPLSAYLISLNITILIFSLLGSLGLVIGFSLIGLHPVQRTKEILSGLYEFGIKIISFFNWVRLKFPHSRGKKRIDPEFEEEMALPVPDDKSLRLQDYIRPASEKPMPSKSPKVKKEMPAPLLDLAQDDDYQLPPLNLLTPPEKVSRVHEVSTEQLEENARLLEEVLNDFGVRGEIVKVRPGPVVTLYELEPAPGIKSSRVISLADDIARSMSALAARVAVIPGKNVIGIELPNKTREIVHLRDLLESQEYEHTKTHLTLALGKDIGGTPVIADLTRMPHLLVAGTTGSGKSVAVNAMILSLLYRLPPEKCKFIMVDPKMLELSIYDGIPHLLAPVVTDPKKAVVALRWVVREMESRYQAMSKLNVRNIEGYNIRIQEAIESGESITRRVQTGFDPETGKPLFENQPLAMEQIPFIVVVVDEMADLMLVAGKEIESTVQRLAQMARAAGIHLIMATQRPSVDVITGTIKANFPTRISFQVTSKIDSRTILGEQGGEQLLGQGDMLYMAAGGRISRVHGPFVSDSDVERIVKYLKMQKEPDYIQDITASEDGPGLPGFENDNEGDQLYQQALDLVMREKKASTSFIQRHLQIGYNRAARIMDQMESEGIVSPANHVGKREVLVS
ncbi:FtsK/SpoIIIE family DNA translocase [Candidatus Bealeia paramacronuclearis]|uniref:FtsK/SpoIIIE family DNA translocase n=1 Tax=Candidatus Bealeia paramacronuclearis TaxID=1921001 RepID=UPI002F26773B